MIKDKIRYIESRYKRLTRLKSLATESVLFKIYEIKPIEKEILLFFSKEKSSNLAIRLGVNRSYIYAVIKKFDDIYSSKEIVEEMK